MRESRHSGSWEKEKLEVQRVTEAERKAVEGGGGGGGGVGPEVEGEGTG